MAVSVHLLGVKGGPAIRPGSSMPTSILLRTGARSVLIDAGLGAARGVCDSGVALTALDLILVTHLHSDHYLELGPLLHTAWTAGLKRPVPVIGPTGLGRYWTHFLAAMEDDVAMRIADEGRPELAPLAEIRRIGEGPVWEGGDLRVTAMRNVHPPLKESFALRIETGGCVVVLSGDTAAMPEMVEFARGADLLVHEALLPAGVEAIVAKVGGGDRLRQHILRSHTTAEEAACIAAEAGVGALALNHLLPDDLPGFGPADWEAAVRKHYAGPLHLGRDGLAIAVDPKG